jgi:hypothetical protein
MLWVTFLPSGSEYHLHILPTAGLGLIHLADFRESESANFKTRNFQRHNWLCRDFLIHIGFS